MGPKQKQTDEFVPQYLYIEDYEPELLPEVDEKETKLEEKIERGVIVIEF